MWVECKQIPPSIRALKVSWVSMKLLVYMVLQKWRGLQPVLWHWGKMNSRREEQVLEAIAEMVGVEVPPTRTGKDAM